MNFKSRKWNALKRRLKLFFGIVITIASIYFTFKALEGLSLSDILSGHVNWWMAGLSTLAFCVSVVLRAMCYPFGLEKSLKFMDAWRIVAVGNAANMVLPLRSGEGVRLAFFPKRFSLVERTRLLLTPGLTDTVIIVIFCVIAVNFLHFRNTMFVSAAHILSFGFLGLCLIVLLLVIVIPKLRKVARSLVTRGYFEMIIWVVLSLLVMMFSVFLGFAAIGYNAADSLQYTLGAYVGMNLIMFLPSSPGGIGLFEYSIILGLTGLGMARIPAEFAALMLHAIQYAALLPVGAVMYLSFLHRLKAENGKVYRRGFAMNSHRRREL